MQYCGYCTPTHKYMATIKPRKTKESFLNLHFTTTISISLVLSLIGIITVIHIATQQISRETKQNIALSVNLLDSIDAESGSRLERYLCAAPWIDKYAYISKDSALVEHIAAVGDNPVEVLGFNPLSASYEIHIIADYANKDSIEAIIIPKLQVFAGIESITYHEQVLEVLNNNINRITVILSTIAALLLLISIVLINNTIRISIYSKRFIIKTMQLVGATNGFIRKPFIRRAHLNALISWIIALVILSAGIFVAQGQLGIEITIEQIISLLPAAAIIITTSHVINHIATVLAVNRYLRLNRNELYLI